LIPPPSAAAQKAPPEVEVVFSPGVAKFSGEAECNVLVALEDTPSARRLARRAHIVVAETELPAPHAHLKFRLRELENALKSVA
jgi:hypothetical protein